MSHGLTLFLIGFYCLLSLLALCEERWPFAVYWTGAAVLTMGVLWMGRT